MNVRKNLKLTNGFNYAYRKFDAPSKDYVDRFLPTNPSVANFMVKDIDMLNKEDDDELLNTLATVKRESLFRNTRNSMPPLIMQPRLQENLPELNATRAKIEQHITKASNKTPMRNVSILISRNSRGLNESNMSGAKTPSYMRENSQMSLNGDIENTGVNNSGNNDGKLPDVIKPAEYVEPEPLEPQSENTLVAKFPVKSKVFQL